MGFEALRGKGAPSIGLEFGSAQRRVVSGRSTFGWSFLGAHRDQPWAPGRESSMRVLVGAGKSRRTRRCLSFSQSVHTPVRPVGRFELRVPAPRPLRCAMRACTPRLRLRPFGNARHAERSAEALTDCSRWPTADVPFLHPQISPRAARALKGTRFYALETSSSCRLPKTVSSHPQRRAMSSHPRDCRGGRVARIPDAFPSQTSRRRSATAPGVLPLPPDFLPLPSDGICAQGSAGDSQRQSAVTDAKRLRGESCAGAGRERVLQRRRERAERAR